MASQARQSLEKRAQRAMLQHAVFRWESAVVIATTLILASLTALNLGPVEFVPEWAWLLGGVLAEAAIVYSSLTDPETGRKVVSEMLRDEFQPQKLNDKRLQQRVEEALDYRGRITAAIRERHNSLLKDELSQTAGQIDEWLESIYNLAQRLDRYQTEREILIRDKRRAAERIQQLDKKLTGELDTKVREQITATIDGMRRQLNTIETLEKTMERAQLQMETTLSSLGTIYSQTMLVDAKDIDSGRAQRLRQDIATEVQELDDVLLAMDEVYASGAG